MSAVGVAGKYFMLLLLGGPQSVHSTAAPAAARCDFGTYEHATTSPFAPTRAAMDEGAESCRDFLLGTATLLIVKNPEYLTIKGLRGKDLSVGRGRGVQ